MSKVPVEIVRSPLLDGEPARTPPPPPPSLPAVPRRRLGSYSQRVTPDRRRRLLGESLPVAKFQSSI